MIEQLTTRENEILQLILEEKTTTEIARDLNISERTVETHRKNIYLKTGAKSLVGLVKLSISKDYRQTEEKNTPKGRFTNE